MANTEGMIDKEMLQMMQHISLSKSSNNNYLKKENDSNINKTTSSRRSRFLQRRNTAIKQKQSRVGGKPIIVSGSCSDRVLPRRVISTSSCPPPNSTFCLDHNSLNHNDNNNYNHDENSGDKDSINNKDMVRMSSNKNVGGLIQDRIMERQVTSHSLNETSAEIMKMNNSGFPSLDLPIGQFTSNRRSKQKIDSKPSVPTISSTSDEAQKILNNMTLTEIHNHVKDLEQSLSPATIAFLKQRKKNKQTSQVKNKNKVNDATSQHNILTTSISNNQALLANENIHENKYDTDVNNSMEQHLQEDSSQEDYDLEKLTALLRSTSFRQRLLAVKRLYQTLHLVNNQSNKIKQKLPLYLPVSLRCLLDESDSTNHSNTVSNMLLQSFTLRAMNQLLQYLLESPQHNNYGNLHKSSINSTDYYDSVHSLYFLQDSFLPTHSTQCNSTTTTSMVQNTTKAMNENVSYYQLTQVQSETSTKDGTAFYKDPIGTLLSRMKIIPRLAHILQNNNKKNILQQEESIVAIIHIFTFLCRKSPGAATVIAQHASILPNLLNYHNKNKKSDITNSPSLYTHSILTLITIIARQSRSAATCINQKYFSDILSFTSSSALPNSTTSPILVWRILLSYGMAIDHVQTMISLSIPKISALLQPSNSKYYYNNNDYNYKEAIYFISSFTKVCHLVKISSLEKQEHSKNQAMYDDDQERNLEMSGIWLSSLVLQAVEYLLSSQPTLQKGQSEYVLCFMAAQLQLIYSYVTAAASSSLNNQNQKKNTVLIVTSEKCQAILESLWEPYILRALREYVLPTALLQEFPSSYDTNNCKEEASACSLVQSYFHLLSSQQKQNSCLKDTPLKNLNKRIYSEICQILEQQIQASKSKDKENNSMENYFMVPLAWQNPAQFEICKFASNYVSSNTNENKKNSWQLFQIFTFALLGKLQRGEEALAAILLSQDFFFVSPGMEEENNFNFSKMLRMELLHYRLQTQLDHSFKLNGGPGILLTNQINRNRIMGPFGLESLRRQVDVSTKPTPKESNDNKASSKDDLFLLPLGPHWLWQILSSTIHLTQQSSIYNHNDHHSMIIQDATNVIISCLQLLNYLEYDRNKNRFAGFYTRQIHVGIKLYHLMNTCMFPEQVLRDDSFASNFLPLLKIYCNTHDDAIFKFSRFFAYSFIHESYQHSLRIHNKEKEKQNLSPSEKNSNFGNKDSADELHIDDGNHEKILSIFLPDNNLSSTNHDKLYVISIPEMKAVNEFISDFCSLFLEYGAQYDFFIHCIRVFLRPCFPNEVRIHTLTKLRGVEHLLTTTDEIEHTQKLKSALTHTLCDRTCDGPYQCSRDYSDFLDILGTHLGRKNNEGNFSLVTKDFFYLFSVGCLSRNLTLHVLLQKDGYCESMQRRLKNIPRQTTQQIIAIAFALITSSNSMSEADLIEFTFEICEKATSAAGDNVEYSKDLQSYYGLEEIWWERQNSKCHHEGDKSSSYFSNQEWNLMIDTMRTKTSSN